MTEWREFKIKDIADVVGGGTPSTAINEYWNGDIPWLTPKDLTGYIRNFISHGERFITKKGLENSSARLLPKGTVLLTSRAPIGYVAIAENEICTNQGFKSLVPNPDKAHNLFLLYWIKSNVEYLQSIGTGTTFQEISGSVLKDVDIILPPLPEQKAIAEVLSSLDDKIDLLTRQNKTLEDLGQAYFRKWFVEDASEDWEEKGLDEIADFLNGLPLQKYPYKSGKPMNVIKIKELNSGYSENTDICSSDVPEKYIVHPGDVIFSWSGSLVVDIWKHGVGALNQHLFKVTSDKYPKWFYYYWIKNYLPEFRIIAESKATTMGHIQRGHLSEAKVLVPRDDELNTMDETLQPLIEKIERNNTQILTLQKLRDTLLPKLISGEVRVKQ
jgi:type I restriction enzyme S subunit